MSEPKNELCKWQLEQMEMYKDKYNPFSVDLDTPTTVSAYNYDKVQDGIYITQWSCDGCEDGNHETNEIYLSKDDYLKLIDLTVKIPTLQTLLTNKIVSENLRLKKRIDELEESIGERFARNE